jgi:hypothetical protein
LAYAYDLEKARFFLQLGQLRLYWEEARSLTAREMSLVLPAMGRMARTMASGRGGMGMGWRHRRTPKGGDR